MRGIAEPAAFIITSGTLASAVSGAIAAAIGEDTSPARICTWSRVISSCASRLPTSALLLVSSRFRSSTLVPGGRSFSCSLR
jgi:hypothetical protein